MVWIRKRNDKVPIDQDNSCIDGAFNEYEVLPVADTQSERREKEVASIQIIIQKNI